MAQIYAAIHVFCEAFESRRSTLKFVAWRRCRQTVWTRVVEQRSARRAIAFDKCFVYAVLLGFCSLARAHSFNGEWNWDAAPSSRNFSLHIIQKGRMLRGQYCAVARNGNRIDCDDKANENIAGKVDVSGQTAKIKFSSFFGAVGGIAVLKLKGNELSWTIIDDPVGGEFYAPSAAVLSQI